MLRLIACLACRDNFAYINLFSLFILFTYLKLLHRKKQSELLDLQIYQAILSTYSTLNERILFKMIYFLYISLGHYRDASKNEIIITKN